jgi:Tol biopolymer transport system component/C-terminal processing protease CtpA/Prc
MNTMSTRFALFGTIILTVIMTLCAASQTRQSAPAFSEPSLAPDGSEIAFVSGGDIWVVPANGGKAQLLVSHPAMEGRPIYSPDGKYLAFTSTRTGNGDIYVLELATGELRRLTWDDGSEQLDAWSRDSQWIYFSSSSHDISGMNDIFRVNVRGGTPMEVSADRYTSEFGAAPGPNESTLAFSARGIASGQWWRHGHSHLDESELWLRHDGAPATYERVAGGGGKQLWPMWTPDGKTLYFMSDRNGQENIWKLSLGGKPEMVTNFTSGRVLWPSMAANGRQIVFERGFCVWKLDLATHAVGEVKIELRGSPSVTAVEHRRFTNEFQDLALSPDGKKMAFIVHGQIFAAPSKDGGDAIRVTRTPGIASQLKWSSDNHRIAYIANRDGHDQVFIYDFNTEHELAITSGTTEQSAPSFSPDGKLLAFQRGTTEIVLYDFGTKKEKALATSIFERPPVFAGVSYDWSPDGQWIAFVSFGARGFRNLSVVPVAGGEARAVSFLANSFSGNVHFGRNGQYLLFNTAQRTEDGNVARIDLVPHTPKFREDQFWELFKEERSPKPQEPTEATQDDSKPTDLKGNTQKDNAQKDNKEQPAKGTRKEPPAKTEVAFEGIRSRLRLVPVGLNVAYQTISPDGKWLGILAASGGQINVYAYSIDELAKDPPVARQLTSTAGRKSSLQFAPDSKELYYLDEGRIQHVALEQPAPKPVAVAAEMDVNFNDEKVEAFEEAWRVLRDNFFDPEMNGVNWQAEHDEFAPRIAAASTPDEMRRLINLMIGELNSSHMGTGRPQDERRFTTGRLGLRFDRAEYEGHGKFRVTEVVGLSAAAVAGIKTGETITSIEGTPLNRWSNLDALLDYAIDRKISVGVADASGKERAVMLKPMRGTVEKNLLYRDWVNRNREYVEKASGGKLGYVHMFDMGMGSLNQLYVDLDTANVSKQGVIVDVRNNNGGFVNAYALDVLSRHGYMTMTPRMLRQSLPARAQLGQRSLELPTILVTNQHSLSDAEDFTEGYRSLGLGKVIGEPTGGWIIYTSGTELIDGTTLRVPFTRIRAQDGTEMELHPRAVDVPVSRAIGESYRNVDTQLDTAVQELMNQIQNKKSTPQRITAQ